LRRSNHRQAKIATAILILIRYFRREPCHLPICKKYRDMIRRQIEAPTKLCLMSQGIRGSTCVTRTPRLAGRGANAVLV
jgi:hypothetical protein